MISLLSERFEADRRLAAPGRPQSLRPALHHRWLAICHGDELLCPIVTDPCAHDPCAQESPRRSGVRRQLAGDVVNIKITFGRNVIHEHLSVVDIEIAELCSVDV